MSYEVRTLSPENIEIFTDYLGNLDFSHSPHWATCFCRYYQTDCTREQWQHRTGEENRLEAIEQIKAGNMSGYLAFDGDKCIGWCNANDVNQYSRIIDDVKHIVNELKVGCVICFVIHPQYRRQGVARLLLSNAVEGFRGKGFDAVIAIPIDSKDAPEKLYRGTLNMYKEQGFEVVENDEDVRVMMLKLK